MSDFNPYEAPRSEVSTQRQVHEHESGVWREGKFLVMSKDAELPDSCVRCNLPADGLRLRRNLSWHAPGWFLLLLISPLVYILVALIVRKTARIEVGLCRKHRSRRRRAIAGGWLLSLVGIGLMILGASRPEFQVASVAVSGALVLLVGLLALLVGIFYGVLGSQVTPPRKIDKHFVWLSQVHPDYLAQLPAWSE